MFEPGAKVVCVDDKFDSKVAALFEQLPKKDEVYTVRDIVPGNHMDLTETVTVYLEEIVNKNNDIDPRTKRPVLERGFACHRFRELDEVQEKVKIKTKKQEPVLV